MFFKNCYTYYPILHIFLQDNARDELVANVDAKFLQLSNYLGCKKFLMGNATTVADFALYDALKWHHALDGHLVAKYGNIVEYIGKQIWPKMYWYIFHEFFLYPEKPSVYFPQSLFFLYYRSVWKSSQSEILFEMPQVSSTIFSTIC